MDIRNNVIIAEAGPAAAADSTEGETVLDIRYFLLGLLSKKEKEREKKKKIEKKVGLKQRITANIGPD